MNAATTNLVDVLEILTSGIAFLPFEVLLRAGTYRKRICDGKDAASVILLALRLPRTSDFDRSFGELGTDPPETEVAYKGVAFSPGETSQSDDGESGL